MSPLIFRTVLVSLAWLLPLRAQEVGAAAAFHRLRLGPVVVSLPPHWASSGPEIPVWLHLHGDRATVEAAFTASGASGILVNVTLPGLSKIYADYFSAPAVFPGLLRDVEAALRRESPDKSWRLARLTVSSFSAGFGGVRQLLNQPVAFERIAALVMADSIYCGYAGDSAEKRVETELMAGFLRFARLAADGEKQMLVTHTRQLPEGYASTTETADYLIRELGGTREPILQEWPGGLRLLSRFARGQLEILGFDGDAGADHGRHLRAVGIFLGRLHVPEGSPQETARSKITP